MLGIETLLGAGGMGALSGVGKLGLNLFMEGIRNKREMEMKRLEADKEITLSSMEARKEMRNTLFNTKPEEVEILNEHEFKITLFGKEFGWNRKSKQDQLVINPLIRAYSRSFWMLVLSLCAITLLWADNPAIPILTLDPSAEPLKWSVFWGFIGGSIPIKEVLTLHTGGLAFLLCHGILGIITHIMVVEGGNHTKR